VEGRLPPDVGGAFIPVGAEFAAFSQFAKVLGSAVRIC
jgi:hypothetical protein